MKNKDYVALSMFIFIVVALAHLYRAVTSTTLMIGHTTVPIWASWVGFIVAGYLAYSAYKLR